VLKAALQSKRLSLSPSPAVENAAGHESKAQLLL